MTDLAVVLHVLLHLAAVLPPLDSDLRHDGGDQLPVGLVALTAAQHVSLVLPQIFPLNTRELARSVKQPGQTCGWNSNVCMG